MTYQVAKGRPLISENKKTHVSEKEFSALVSRLLVNSRRKKISINEFGARIGINGMTLNRWASGTISPPMRERLRYYHFLSRIDFSEPLKSINQSKAFKI